MNEINRNSGYFVTTIKCKDFITIGIKNKEVVDIGWDTANKITGKEVKAYLLEAIKLLK